MRDAALVRLLHQLYVGRMLFNALLQMDAGDFAGADETCQAALERVRRYHLWQLGVNATVQRADATARCGKAEAALQLLDRAETHPLHPMSFEANRISTADRSRCSLSTRRSDYTRSHARRRRSRHPTQRCTC